MIIVDPRDPADARPRKVPSPSRSPSKHNESGLPKISQPDIAILVASTVGHPSANQSVSS